MALVRTMMRLAYEIAGALSTQHAVSTRISDAYLREARYGLSPLGSDGNLSPKLESLYLQNLKKEEPSRPVSTSTTRRARRTPGSR